MPRTPKKCLPPKSVDLDAGTSYVRFDPLGPILAVMPWNFPFWQVFRFAAPALMAGNVCLLKHASNVPGCAAAIEDIFRQAGFPEHVFTTLRIGSGPVEALIAHPLVRAVTLTGSERPGARSPNGRAQPEKSGPGTGRQRSLHRPGRCPAGQSAWPTAVSARMINNGQSCIAAKRFIVEAKILDRFRTAFVAAVAALKVGDPLDESNDLGPLARADLVDELERQVQESVRRGARILTGGKRLSDRPGFYFQPTVLDDVRPGMPAYDEELFGPVAALISARDEEDAVRIANDTPFGLGASIWTEDRDRAKKWRRPSKRAWSSSTAWSSPIRACPSAASRCRASAASCPITASRSS